MAFVDPRAAVCYGDCADSMPSSAASEDTLDIPDADINIGRLQDAVNLLLRGIGEDVKREGLRDTPKVSGSVAKQPQFLRMQSNELIIIVLYCRGSQRLGSMPLKATGKALTGWFSLKASNTEQKCIFQSSKYMYSFIAVCLAALYSTRISAVGETTVSSSSRT